MNAKQRKKDKKFRAKIAKEFILLMRELADEVESTNMPQDEFISRVRELEVILTDPIMKAV